MRIPFRRRIRRRYRLVLGVLACAAAIALFGAGLRFAEDRMKQREGLGDTGGWGWNEAGETVTLKFDGQRYTYSDAVDYYLMIGTDATGNNPEAKQGFNGNMADFLMVLAVNRTKKRFGFLQLDRDTMTDVPILDEKGEEIGTSKEQLCIAHWYGQNEEQRNRNTVTAVSRLLGRIPIKGYYSINMKDVDKLNHAVGGVQVTIEDDLTRIDPSMSPGAVVTLKDDQVERYLRARMGVGDGTNTSRMRRQRTYLQSLYSLVTGRLKEDPNYINGLYKELKDVVDSDLPSKEISQLAAEFSEFEGLGFKTLEGESTTGKAFYDGEIHAEFYPETASILSVLGEFAELKAE